MSHIHDPGAVDLAHQQAERAILEPAAIVRCVAATRPMTK
jgi:hypothetical protein